MQPQIAHALTSRHKSSDVQQPVLAQLDCWKRDRLHLGREAGRAALLAVKAPAAERAVPQVVHAWRPHFMQALFS